MANFYTPTKKHSLPQQKQVDILALDTFGQGIANDNGKTVFVHQALPGEKVDIRFIENKKHYAKAKVIKRYNQSTDRVEPLCQHFGLCGGCQLQHASTQLVQQSKLDALCYLLKRESGACLDCASKEIISASPYHYRRRARLSLRIVKNTLMMGFKQETSSDIVDIQMCPILVNELEALINPLRDCLKQLDMKRHLGHVELIAVDSGTIIVLRHIQPMSEKDISNLKQFALSQQVSIYLHGEELVCLHGDETPYYQLDNLTLTFSPLDFIQVNADINRLMVAKSLDWLVLNHDDKVLDLFCGMGNFSLPIAKIAKQVIGVEGVAELVEKAKINTDLNNEKYIKDNLNAIFYQQNLDNIDVNAIWLKNREINKVLLDPARAGALNIMAMLVSFDFSDIVYISCNPATLARDSKILIEAGYKIDKLAILDMFPQTKHIESMVRFIK